MKKKLFVEAGVAMLIIAYLACAMIIPSRDELRRHSR